MRRTVVLAVVLILVTVAPFPAGAGDLASSSAAPPPPGAHAQAHHHVEHLTRPDALPPIGVMGGHAHEKGGGMLSYRYMRMSMNGNRDGTTRLGSADILRDYMVSPTRMQMDMHMIGLMYAPLERLTLMGMVPLIRMDMDHVTRTGRKFTTKSNGVGDLSLTALYRFFESDHHALDAGTGISFPTGDIEVFDKTPMGRTLLPYPMRLGSGTYGLLPGVTYTGQTASYSWGAQGVMILPMGRNHRNYRPGNEYGATGWLARRWSSWVSTGVRLDWHKWSDIHGADKSLMPMMVPTADPELRGGDRLSGGVSVNLSMPRGPLAGNRLSIEYLFPIYQSLDGPQLETDAQIFAGWQYLF